MLAVLRLSIFVVFASQGCYQGVPKLKLLLHIRQHVGQVFRLQSILEAQGSCRQRGWCKQLRKRLAVVHQILHLVLSLLEAFERRRDVVQNGRLVLGSPQQDDATTDLGRYPYGSLDLEG